MAKLETLKVQRSIMTTEDEHQMLIYNENKSFTAQIPFESLPGKCFLNLFMEGELKIYVTAEVRQYYGPLAFAVFDVTRIPDQDW